MLHKIPGPDFLFQVLFTGTISCSWELPPGERSRLNFTWSLYFDCCKFFIGISSRISNAEDVFLKTYKQESKSAALSVFLWSSAANNKRSVLQLILLLEATMFWLISQQLTQVDILCLVKRQRILCCSKCVRFTDDDKHKRPWDNGKLDLFISFLFPQLLVFKCKIEHH